jgi:hypothetical protein
VGRVNPSQYPVRFAWRAHSYGTPDSFGQAVDVYAASVALWGGYASERYGGTVETLESEQALGGCTIRLRNYPAVGPLDTLTDPQTGEVWTVASVARGSNEVLAEVTG